MTYEYRVGPKTAKINAKPTTKHAASSVTEREPRGIAIRRKRYAQCEKAMYSYLL